MAQIKSLVHLTSRSFVVTFPEDVSPTDAADRTKWSIVGTDHQMLPIESILPAHPPAPIMPAYPPYPGEILPAYPPISIRDYLVFTGLPTNQPYNLTVVGLTSPDGTLFPPFTWNWTPMQPPTAYPSDGIMKPSVDGDSVGSRIQIAIPPVPPDWLIHVKGLGSDNTEYPFTRDPNDGRYWFLHTMPIKTADPGFKVRPIPDPAHVNDFSGGQLADLHLPLLQSPFAPQMLAGALRNMTRPDENVFYPTDQIGGTISARADQIRGLRVRLLRGEEVIGTILPYYPPGANDPNNPNYDPQAPANGSGNPLSYLLPPKPNLPFHPWIPDQGPPWLPCPSPININELIGGILPAYPPGVNAGEPWGLAIPPFKPSDLNLTPGQYQAIIEAFDEADRSTRFEMPFSVELPVEIPGVGKVGPSLFDYDLDGNLYASFGTMQNGRIRLHTWDASVQGMNLIYERQGVSQQEPLTEDANAPGYWSLDTGPLGLSNDEKANAQLETTFAGTPPHSVRTDFPLFEPPTALDPSVSLTDWAGQTPLVMDPWETYRISVGNVFMHRGETVDVFAAYVDQNGNPRQAPLGSHRAEGTTTDFSFSRTGSDLNVSFGGQGTSDRKIVAVHTLADGSTRTGYQSVAAQTPSKSFEQAVSDATQEYLDLDPGKRHYKWKSKLSAAELEHSSAPNGVDCSGMYFQVLHKALVESGVARGGMNDVFANSSNPSGNQFTPTNWGGEDVRDNKIFKDVDSANKTNPRIKDLRVGDAIDYNVPPDPQTHQRRGHVSFISKIQESTQNEHLEVTVAQSAGRFDGPHESTFDVSKVDYENGKRLQGVEEGDWHGDANEKHLAHQSIVARDSGGYNTGVRRARVVDDYYKKKEAS